MSKKCTPLWREPHVQVKRLNAFHVRGTFWSCDVEKVHAVVARSTFRRQSVKTDVFGPLFEVAMMKKCTPLWREAHFEVNMLNAPHARTAFGRSDVVLRGRRKGLCTLSKVSKTWGFCRISKNHGRRGTCEEDLPRCMSRGRRSTRDMFIRVVRRSGRLFPDRGCILEHQIFRFAEMILRGRCSTSYDLASLFRGRRSSLDRWSGKIANRIGKRPSALHSTFDFEGRLVELLRFWCCQLKKWGSLAELLCFWRCQVQKLRTSRWISAFLLSSSKTEEVSQNSFVFKLADRQIDRQLQRPLQLHYFYNYNYKYMCKITTLRYTTQITLHYANCTTLR